MTQDEFRKFFKYISSVTTDTNPSPERTQVYYDTLNDLSFDVAMVAARKVIATLENPFLPMPAVFRSMALSVTGQSVPVAPDSWAEVTRAIRNFGSYREPEALASMTPLTRKVVQSFGYQELCHSENIEVIRGQFRMAYEALEKRETVDAKTPQRLKDVISAMGGQVLEIAERVKPRMISQHEDDELDSLEEIIDNSNKVRKLLARAAKNRPRESQLITKTSPEELEKLYL